MNFDMSTMVEFLSVKAFFALTPAAVCIIVRRFGAAIVAVTLGVGGLAATKGFLLIFPGIVAIIIAWIIAAVAIASARRSRELEAIRREVADLRDNRNGKNG